MSLSVNVADLRGLSPAPKLRRPGSGGAPGGTRRLDERRDASPSLCRPELSREIASKRSRNPLTRLGSGGGRAPGAACRHDASGAACSAGAAASAGASASIPSARSASISRERSSASRAAHSSSAPSSATGRVHAAPSPDDARSGDGRGAHEAGSVFIAGSAIELVAAGESEGPKHTLSRVFDAHSSDRDVYDAELAPLLPGFRHLPYTKWQTWAVDAIDGTLEPPLDPSLETVFMDHRGGRGERIMQYFAQNGFSKARWVRGGINAYSEEADPSVPTYLESDGDCLTCHEH